MNLFVFLFFFGMHNFFMLYRSRHSFAKNDWKTTKMTYLNLMFIYIYYLFLFCVFSFMWFMIKVTFGEHDRCDDKTRPETRFVLRAISQPFSFSNFDNDVALLRLNDRVPITDFIRPICLPSKQSMLSFFSMQLIITDLLYFCSESFR